MGSSCSKFMKGRNPPSTSKIPTEEEYAAQAELWKSRVDPTKLFFQFPGPDEEIVEKSARKEKQPKDKLNLGVKKCWSGHYFHESLKCCNECGRGPISNKIDFKVLNKELEDDVFSQENDGPDLEYFDLIRCENGHIRSKRIAFCKKCN